MVVRVVDRVRQCQHGVLQDLVDDLHGQRRPLGLLCVADGAFHVLGKEMGGFDGEAGDRLRDLGCGDLSH